MWLGNSHFQFSQIGRDLFGDFHRPLATWPLLRFGLYQRPDSWVGDLLRYLKWFWAGLVRISWNTSVVLFLRYGRHDRAIGGKQLLHFNQNAGSGLLG